MSITPFADDGALDEEALREHVAWTTSGGAGVYLCSQGSGEGHLLTRDERVRVFEVGVDAVGGSAPVYAAGVGLSDTATALDLGKAALAAGVDAVQVLPPHVGAAPPRPHELEGYYRDLLEALDGPVFLSHNAYLAGYNLSLRLLELMAEQHPNLQGINWSDPAIPSLSPLIAALGDRLEIRVGVVGQLPVVKALGGHGVLCFESNVDPALATQTWDRFDLDRFARLLALNDVLSRPGNPRSLKAALALMGRPSGALRRPYLPLQGEGLDGLAEGLRGLGYVG